VDLPTGSKDPKRTSLSLEDEAVVVALRRHTPLPIDDSLYALQATIPRSSLDRCLQRHGISRNSASSGRSHARRTPTAGRSVPASCAAPYRHRRRQHVLPGGCCILCRHRGVGQRWLGACIGRTVTLVASGFRPLSEESCRWPGQLVDSAKLRHWLNDRGTKPIVPNASKRCRHRRTALFVLARRVTSWLAKAPLGLLVGKRGPPAMRRPASCLPALY
jgi:hypothetical protein